uniref:Selenoprotein M n=1 Tax=Taeniopygia guttata TaxID=59729 RepID=A0A674G769_TAEGU
SGLPNAQPGPTGRSPQVKAFVTQDIPLYHNLEMKHLPGADPELVLLSVRYEELERIPLSDMTREEINQLVQELEEFQFAPAKSLPILLHPQAPTADGKTPPKHDKEEHPDL